MKSVAHVITTIQRGGAENQLLILVEAQVQSGRAVSVVFLKGEPELQEKFENVGAHVVHLLHGKNPIRQIFYLHSYLKRLDNHILHCHLPRAELISTLANINLRKPLIISRHNSERFFPKAPSLVSRLLSRFVTSRATYCVAISEAVLNYLFASRELSLRCPFEVVYYGLPRKASPLIKKHSKKRKVIGTIARLTIQKDLPTLLKAVKYLEQRLTCELVIVGDGELRDELINLAKQLNLSDISWKGKVSDVSRELSEMDVFVLPSLYEGFGLVLLEAMNAGVPIVAARNSAIPEVLGKDYPYLFDTGDFQKLSSAIEAVLLSNTDDLIQLGFQRLEEFNITKMLTKMDRIYFIAEDEK